MILTFGIWAIFYIIRYYKNQNLKNTALLAIFSSLAFLVHPNGILFLANCGLIVVFVSLKNKSIKSLLLYSAICLITCGIPFLYVFSDPKILEEFLFQAQDRNVISNHLGFFQNLSEFFSTYTLGVKRLYILIFEVGILLTGIFLRKENLHILFPILGVLNLVLSFTIFNPYVTRHFGEIPIYSIIIFALILNKAEIPKPFFKILFGLGLLYLLNNLAGDIYIIEKNRKIFLILKFVKNSKPL